mgnify:CR=1 FL=1
MVAPISDARKRANDKYLGNQDEIKVRVPKGRKAEIQTAADGIGESLNKFIATAIDERMERILALHRESKTGKKTDE